MSSAASGSGRGANKKISYIAHATFTMLSRLEGTNT